MSHPFHQIHIRKESLKFSAAHMTVFPDGRKEHLHGHNYTTEVSLSLKDGSLKRMVSFSYFKEIIQDLCVAWDERVLIQKDCPFFDLKSETPQEVEFLVCGKRYILPQEEVIFLPLDNITAESLAEEFCRRFVAKLDPGYLHSNVLEVRVKIEESPGQGSTSFWKAP